MRRWLRKQLDRQLGKLRQARQQRKTDSQQLLKARYHVFRALLASNNRAVDCLTEISIHLRLQGDSLGLAQLIHRLIEETAEMIARLENLASGRYRGLQVAHHAVAQRLQATLAGLTSSGNVPSVLPLAQIHSGLKDQTGNKAAALAELRKNGLPVPDGFVITLAGCRFFLEHGGLSMELVHLLATQGADKEKNVSSATAAQVKGLITGAVIPPVLAEEITEAARVFFENGKPLAVRSSSISEDGRHHSFAGQFSSVLNVCDAAQFLEAFKQVVASNFNARSLAYRLNAGLDPLRFDMAVLCLEMVEARAAGVLLTRSPQEPESGQMLISAVPGLGEAAVSGSAATDLYLVNADGQVDWTRSTIADKERLLVCEKAGGVVWQELAVEARNQPVLGEGELRSLAGWGRELEKREGMPLDLEWAVNPEGAVVILQVRPMTTMGIQTGDNREEKSSPLLQGVISSGGRASGRVLLVKSRRDFEHLPQEPVVLVMHQSFVEAANLLGQVAAVLVELGSPADHLACVAREQETPMLCGMQEASAVLSEGQWLTVDGSHGRVYKATADEIAATEKRWQNGPPQPHRMRVPLPPLHRELQELVTVLHLTDAYGPTFSILECKSLHDIVRFVHEKAVLAMFHAGDELLEENFGAVHAIDAPVPFFVSVIDMGGGLALTGPLRRRIPPEAVVSRPFQALWQGITTPGLHWGPPPGGAPMGSVMSSFLTDQKSERPIGMPNYAMVSRDYCNMNARMDFHFIMIDAVASLEPRSNHIKFRFKGGGTSLERRRRRALCIGEIFEQHGFFVDVKEDLVNASLQGASREAIEEKLVMVGRILGFTRLLDAAMGTDAMIPAVARAFMEGNYALVGLTDNEETAQVAG
ncbi:PEP/pyruvate-binding domain-containing protein [Thiovibrio frasassiensis]|uniref:Phosphoenolpyruvate synthase n=1 Tax=Thiovibrio frasassiensis TaxID=2984131 RepID=A0A9X4MJI1_9BACT|nr:PEP/pyruvate-binding domain-containing protein [Thiovibrio frasassiensis]MDG4476668.1 PEP-utilizing enzyme [Thiovibrio frasassiensis]